VNDRPVVFGLPALWNESFQAHSDVYHALDRVQLVADDLIKATQDDKSDLVEVLRALTSVNNAGMTDVVILTGNRRGAGAMKVARSMFEVSITAEYLEKNPAETDLYLDFAHVIAWKHLQDLERKSPGKVPPEHKRQSETQYNRVKAKFEKNGKVRNNWTDKTIKKLAEAIGPDRANLYEVIYGLASELHHVNVAGLIGHELEWASEALRVGHGALLQTLVSLYNTYHKPGTEFRERINELVKDFDRVWKEHVTARDRKP
jgi:uncharacterized protein DUF5677